MNRKQKIKMISIMSVLVLFSFASALTLYALKQNINLFYTPTELKTAKVSLMQNFRIGGYVKMHSVHYDSKGESVSFVVTDRINDLLVNYHGVLPNLFREGQTVVITGKLTPEHSFIANEVLAKHDEKYMPKPLAEKLKSQGKINAA